MSEKKYPIPGGLVEKPEIDFDSAITKRWKLPFFLGFAWGWFYISGLNVKTFTQLVDSTPYWNLIIVGWALALMFMRKIIKKFRDSNYLFGFSMRLYAICAWLGCGVFGFYVTSIFYLF